MKILLVATFATLAVLKGVQASDARVPNDVSVRERPAGRSMHLFNRAQELEGILGMMNGRAFGASAEPVPLPANPELAQLVQQLPPQFKQMVESQIRLQVERATSSNPAVSEALVAEVVAQVMTEAQVPSVVQQRVKIAGIAHAREVCASMRRAATGPRPARGLEELLSLFAAPMPEDRD
ncbi:MAG: hypothetical protein MHM6MM_002945 [Cercozoa sp. M6MM]